MDKSKAKEARIAEKKTLLRLANILCCRLRTDKNGDPFIAGRGENNIHADGESSYCIFVSLETSQQWTYCKRKLKFCQVSQDGDAEGCLRLAAPPTTEQAAILREVLGIRKIKTYSPSVLAVLRERAKNARACLVAKPPTAAEPTPPRMVG